MTGIELIDLERSNHPDTDDLQWDEGQLAAAAAVYASPFEVFRYDGRGYRRAWTWEKPDDRAKHDRLKQLVRAGALVAAEIDRCLIKEMRKSDRRWERFCAAWYLYRFKFRLGRWRAFWGARWLSKQ